MLQIRFHGRGGQGVVTAAELLSIAAFHDGDFAQAFPSFGPERTGAPVTAYCRIDAKPIRAHDPIERPDVVVVEDATLVGHPDVLAGTDARTLVLVNAPAPVDLPGVRVRTVAAAGRTNAMMLGALVHATNAVRFVALVAAIRDRFHGDACEDNLAAARAGFEAVRC